MTQFRTIRQIAATGLLPEHRLRLMQKRGELPGIFAGSRFYVNEEALLRQLEAQSMQQEGKAQ